MAYHTLTWLAWLAAAAYLALANQQPLQSIALIMAAGMVYDLASRRSPQGQGWDAFLRLGLWVWLVALAFNLLSVHAGDRLLFTLPRNWPIIGGPITLEALLYGLASGASLFAVLLVFAAFNLGVEAHRLLRWVPGGLFQAGLVVSIALAFVPQMMASLQDIRDAQRVRGHQFRRLRDSVPLLVPLVTTALERSLRLAESMEARGFGGIAQEGRPAKRKLLRLATLGGLLCLGIGLLWRALYPQSPAVYTAWLGLGALLSLLTIYARGRQVKRTHYQHELWRQRDTWVTVASAVSVLMVLLAQVQNAEALFYYPYPPFSPWPGFAPLVGLAAALLAAPAFLWPTQVHESHTKDTKQEKC